VIPIAIAGGENLPARERLADPANIMHTYAL